MAEGRMLSRRISRSHKLANLSSDTSRMIYSWLIPYLDVDGRMEADPDLIKADVAPLLKHITPAIIGSVLNELQEVGLIALYSISGKICLQLQQFEKNQKNLRKDREAPSSIPAYDKSFPVWTYSGPTPDLLRTYSGIREVEEKRSLREANTREKDKNHLPVDNSKSDDEECPPFDPPKTEPEKPKEPVEKEFEKPKPTNTHGERWTEKQGADLDELMQDITKRYGSRYHQQVYVFVQGNFNKGNPDGVLHCLRRLISDRLAGKSIPLPGKWLEAVLNGNGNHPGENGTFEARESERQHEAMKRDESRDVARMISGIGRGV